MESKDIVVRPPLSRPDKWRLCEKEGGVEKAGQKIDNALDSAKEKIDKATK